mgnify:CR=1 FL=1
MRAGKLRTRGTIESPVEAPNDTGEPMTTWSPYAVVWADVEALSGREQFTAQQDASLVQYRVTMRYVAGVTAAMRFRVGLQVLDIEAAMDSGQRGEELVLHCLERKVGA